MPCLGHYTPSLLLHIQLFRTKDKMHSILFLSHLLAIAIKQIQANQINCAGINTLFIIMDRQTRTKLLILFISSCRTVSKLF